MSKNIAVPKGIYDDLRKEYRRIRSKASENPWMTFSEFVVAVFRLGTKRFMELADKNKLGLAEFLKFIEAEVT